MRTDPVHAEDCLVPIAAGGGVIAAFDSINGGIRMVGRDSDARVLTGPGEYAVPGIPAIHHAVVRGTRLRVTIEPFVAIPSAHRARKLEIEVPVGTTIEGVVPGGDGWIVARTSPSTARIVALRDGRGIDVALTANERVVAVWPEGRAVVQSTSGWRIGHSARRPGTVISAGTDALVARSDPKGRRSFRFVDALGTDRALAGPAEWRVDDAVVHGRRAIASCLHPQLGYALWDGSRLERTDGTIALFSLGGDAPVIRTTGAAAGSTWRTGANVVSGDIPGRDDLQVNPRVVNELPTVLISGNSIDGLVIALHGGPDSLEWDDLRYGGLYRTLADAGLATLVVNAPGSRGFGRKLHEEGWADWTAAATRVAGVGRSVAASLGVRSTAILGVSFGAWLAVQVADLLGAERVVAVSPVLDLTAHIRTHNAEPEYDSWARHRFGRNLELAAAGDRAGARCRAAVTVVLPEGDRVVDPARTAAVASERGWQVVRVPEGHTPTTATGAALRWAAIRRALIEVPRQT